MIYAVIDTNVILSALITKHDDAATFKVIERVAKGDITPIYNEEIIHEYKEVLSRTKFHLASSEIDRVLDYFYSRGMVMEGVTYNEKMPDEDDRVFYEVSLSKADSFLVTGNLKHFPVSPQIISPAALILLMDV